MKEKTEADTKQSVNTLLIVLLIIASFLIGSLWTNVEYLKKGYVQASPSANQGVTQPKAGVTAPSNNQPAKAGNSASTSDNVPKITKSDHIRGDPNAPIALIEYSDLECPFCKKFHPTAQQVLDFYKGKVMWVYRHFPLSFHANAQKEAEAAECANELGGNDVFWKYIDKIYEKTTSNGTGFALDKLAPQAKELGLNEVKFKTCLDSGKYTKLISQEETDGQSAGVNGTPGNIILNLKSGKTAEIPGAVSFEQIKAVIDKML